MSDKDYLCPTCECASLDWCSITASVNRAVKTCDLYRPKATEESNSSSMACSTPRRWVLALRPEYAISRGMFSRPGHRGYTNNIDDAGRYDEVEAMKFQREQPDKYVALELAQA